MKTFMRFTVSTIILILLSIQAFAFVFNPNSHIKVYYEYCERAMYLEFVFFQTQGENDRMNYFEFDHNPATGPAYLLLNFRHQSQISNTSGWTQVDTTGPGSNFWYIFEAGAFNFETEFVNYYTQDDDEGFKYWVRYRLKTLPQTAIEVFAASGFWRPSR